MVERGNHLCIRAYPTGRLRAACNLQFSNQDTERDQGFPTGKNFRSSALHARATASVSQLFAQKHRERLQLRSLPTPGHPPQPPMRDDGGAAGTYSLIQVELPKEGTVRVIYET
jgi:hypothetical protein